jgi:hypothetical protein
LNSIILNKEEYQALNEIISAERSMLFAINNSRYGKYTEETDSLEVKNLKEEDLILIDQTTLRNDQGTILMTNSKHSVSSIAIFSE